LLLRPLSVGRFASLRFRPKNMAHHISQLESELQNIPEAAPEASRSFSVSEKLARYGSSALSGVEHLTLLVGKKSVALALIRHFGSLKGLARASFQELRQFLPRRQAESVVAALSMSVIAETEHARSEQLDNPESIYRACADMKLFSQEVLRVILLDTRYRLDKSRDWSQLRRLVREFHVELFDITPSPALGWIVALDDRVLGFVKMPPGMAIG
jgi:hypothetical protein